MVEIFEIQLSLGCEVVVPFLPHKHVAYGEIDYSQPYFFYYCSLQIKINTWTLIQLSQKRDPQFGFCGSQLSHSE